MPVHRLGQDKVDYELQLALKLSVEDAFCVPDMSRIVPLPASDETRHQSSAESSNDGACESASAMPAPRSPLARNSLEVTGHGSTQAKSARPPETETDGSSATPALQAASSISARDTKKKQKRFEDDSANSPAQQVIQVKPASGRVAKRRTIDDSDEEEQGVGSASVTSHRGLVSKGGCAERADKIPLLNSPNKGKSGEESDTIPDSEGEDNEQRIQGMGQQSPCIAKKILGLPRRKGV